MKVGIDSVESCRSTKKQRFEKITRTFAGETLEQKLGNLGGGGLGGARPAKPAIKLLSLRTTGCGSVSCCGVTQMRMHVRQARNLPVCVMLPILLIGRDGVTARAFANGHDAAGAIESKGRGSIPCIRVFLLRCLVLTLGMPPSGGTGEEDMEGGAERS
eukprot:2454218-Rhodomonas_salina.2